MTHANKVIWAYGSALYDDGQTNSRNEFSKYFLRLFPDLKFPPKVSVFDVWVDPATGEFASWATKVPDFTLDSDIPIQACLVHNSETIRVKFFLDLLVDSKFPVMLIGLAGSGKTLLMSEKLEEQRAELDIGGCTLL